MNTPTSSYRSAELTNKLMSEQGKRGSRIISPSNCLSFGFIPPNDSGIKSGEIYLKLGFKGSGKLRLGGFGVRHIWDKHRTDLRLTSPSEIPEKLTQILTIGMDILVDFKKEREDPRPVVLNTEIGRVVLSSFDNNGENAYSIVSAYGHKNAPGTVIGQLQHTQLD